MKRKFLPLNKIIIVEKEGGERKRTKREGERWKKIFSSFQFLVICGCLLAVGQAGVIGGSLLAAAPAAVAVQPAAAAATLPLSTATLAVPTIATSTSNVIRGIGNLGAISAYAKSIDTPFSSVRKADVRVNNPGIVTATAVPAPVVAVANTAIAGTWLPGVPIYFL